MGAEVVQTFPSSGESKANHIELLFVRWESCLKSTFDVGLAPRSRSRVASFDDACRHAGDDTMIRKFAAYYGVGPYNAMISKLGTSLNFCASADETEVSNPRSLYYQGLGENVDSLYIETVIVVRYHDIKAEGAVHADFQVCGGN